MSFNGFWRYQGPQAELWQPTESASTVMAFNARDANTVDLNGGNVAELKDLTGTYDLTQGTAANQPVYGADGGVQFPYSGLKSLDSVSVPSVFTEANLILVAFRTNILASDTSRVFNITDIPSASRIMMLIQDVSGVKQIGASHSNGFYDAVSGGFGLPLTDNTSYIALMTYDGTSSVNLRLQGGELSATHAQGADFSPTLFTLGNLVDGGSFEAGVDIYSFTISTDTSYGNRVRLEGWSAWNMPTVPTLAAGHPFRNAAPTVEWVPSDHADLVGWYDCTDSSCLTLVDGVVSELKDKSKEQNHAVQTTPANRGSVVNGFFQANAASDSNLLMTAADTIREAYVVYKNWSGNNYSIIKGSGGAPFTYLANVYSIITGGSGFSTMKASLNDEILEPASATTTVTLEEGAPLPSQNTPDVICMQFTSGISQQQLPSASESAGSVEIAEWLFFDQPLSEADRAKVFGYLAHKHGRPLDIGSQYYNRPPTIND